MDQPTLFQSATVVDENGQTKTGVNLLIEQGKISWVEQGDCITQPEWQVIDCQGLVLTPSFVNTHCHCAMVLLRGLGEDLEIEDWFNDFIWAYESRLTPADVKLGAKLGIAEMIKNGVSAFADHYFFAASVAEAACEMGVRADIAPTIFGLADDVDDQIRQSEELINHWNLKKGPVRMRLGPHAPYTCPPHVLAKTVESAKRLGVGIHIHLAETKEQVEASINQYGKSPVEILAEVGAFDVPVLIAHGLWLKENDLPLISQDAVVAACPKTYLKLSMGFGTLWEYSNRLTVTIGTDGAASSNTLSPLEQLRLYALIGK